MAVDAHRSSVDRGEQNHRATGRVSGCGDRRLSQSTRLTYSARRLARANGDDRRASHNDEVRPISPYGRRSRPRVRSNRSSHNRERRRPQRRPPSVVDCRRWLALGRRASMSVITTLPSATPLPSPGRLSYRRFWAGVGERFPDLGGAVSTRYYAENERRLFTDHFPDLDGLKIFKTDLW